MPIAARFSRTHGPDLTADRTMGLVNPLVAGLNEADYKRAQLLNDLLAATNAAMGVIGQIEGLVFDIEATKQD